MRRKNNRYERGKEDAKKREERRKGEESGKGRKGEAGKGTERGWRMGMRERKSEKQGGVANTRNHLLLYC